MWKSSREELAISYDTIIAVSVSHMTRKRRAWHGDDQILGQTDILVKTLQNAPSSVPRSARQTSSMVSYSETLHRQNGASADRSSNYAANAINRHW